MDAKEAIRAIIDMLRSYKQEPDDAGDIEEQLTPDIQDDITIYSLDDIQDAINIITQKLTDTIVSEICDMDVLPKEEIMNIYYKER